MRKGYGVGKGRGYRNLMPMDSHIHSLSAKGVKTYTVRGSRFKYDADARPVNLPDSFGRARTIRKKGLIKEIARNVKAGVGWAIEWERRHLPEQREWVQKEYEKAKASTKNILKKGKDFVKHEIEKKQHKEFEKEMQKDLEDMRDEMDIDDDGTQDISLETLEEVNEGIRQDLDGIDIDKSGVPDYQEHSPLDYRSEIHVDKPSILPSLNPSGMSHEPDLLPDVDLKPKSSILHNLLQSTKEKGSEIIEHRKELHEELLGMTDAQLKERSKREGGGFFGLGKDAYEKELLRRIEKDRLLNLEIQKAKNKPLKERSGLGVGFLNPVGTLSNNKNKQKTKSMPMNNGLSQSFGFINPLSTFKKRG